MTFSLEANQLAAPFSLPNLPYAKEAFGSVMSAETFDYHHGKHHQAYVTNLNKLLEEKSELAGQDLEQLISNSFKNSSLGGIFNNAAQVWNHSFFWHSIKPQGGGKPTGELLAKIEEDFGSFEKFAEEFKQAGATQFGSGWAWLVYDNGKLKVTKTANAETPICLNQFPLLCCDVWEHAYYIDYRNRRPDFLSAFLNELVNWDFASDNLANAQK